MVGLDPTISGRMWRWKNASLVLRSSGLRGVYRRAGKRPDPMAPPEDDATACTYVIALASPPARVVRGERDARAPALKILAAGFPASRAAISVRRPPRWPRAGSPLRNHVPWHVPTVVWGGRISDGRLVPNWPSASRARSTRCAPAAGADPAPLQDASGSTPHGQDACLYSYHSQLSRARLIIPPREGRAGWGGSADMLRQASRRRPGCFATRPSPRISAVAEMRFLRTQVGNS